jgi:transposase
MSINQIYFNEFFGYKQEKLKLFLDELELPKDDPIFTLKSILEELDFSKLLNQYKSKGRKGYNPIMMFALLVYANMRGIRSIDDIVNSCKRDICFMTLSNKQTPSRDAFYDFKNKKLKNFILENLHHQLIIKLKERGFLSLEKIFVDGTKIEANANRYTFVWRGSINYHLINLLDNINNTYSCYNQLIYEKGYDKKYQLQKIDFLIIEGSDKVRDIINKNKSREKEGIKKLSNNHVLKIENIGPNILMKLEETLNNIMLSEGIELVYGQGCRKSALQKLYETIKNYRKRLNKYASAFTYMGDDRNSYSKTDKDATFMRMKDDHMLNGQLKPGYNVQFAVENYFIVDTYVSNDRTDYKTLEPIVKKHITNTGIKLKELIADSGYCSEAGLRYLATEKIEPYIKLQEHENQKTRKYKNNIGKHYNMKRLEDGSYECASGRILLYEKTQKSYIKGFEQRYEVYSCKDCSGCNRKKECLYKYNEKRDKEINV